MTSFVLRPVILNDLDQLNVLIEKMTNPMASLPHDKSLLKKRIRLSERSFKKTMLQGVGEYYLFVVEDTASNEIVGTSAINAKVGGQNFFFVYTIQKEEFSYPPLDISKTVDLLHLKKVQKGPLELGSLYLNPEYRKHRLGTLLSLGRFLYMNAFPQRFVGDIVANLKGIRDEKGDSPFWESIGEIFFGASLTTVEAMKSLGAKMFIRALMPRYPIYIPLLQLKAQKVIGKVCLDSQPAFHLLTKEGFRKSEWVDIFDAGPFLTAKIEEIRTIQNISSGKIGRITDPENESEKGEYLIAANNSFNFRVCLGNVTLASHGTIDIDVNVAKVLKVKIGSIVSFTKY